MHAVKVSLGNRCPNKCALKLSKYIQETSLLRCLRMSSQGNAFPQDSALEGRT